MKTITTGNLFGLNGKISVPKWRNYPNKYVTLCPSSWTNKGREITDEDELLITGAFG